MDLTASNVSSSTADSPVAKLAAPSISSAALTAMNCSTSSWKRTHFLEELEEGDDLPEASEGNEDSSETDTADDERFSNISHIRRCLRIGFKSMSAYDTDLVSFDRQFESIEATARKAGGVCLCNGP